MEFHFCVENTPPSSKRIVICIRPIGKSSFSLSLCDVNFIALFMDDVTFTFHRRQKKHITESVNKKAKKPLRLIRVLRQRRNTICDQIERYVTSCKWFYVYASSAVDIIRSSIRNLPTAQMLH